jgi:transposase
MAADALLRARTALVEQLDRLQRRLVSLARQDIRARLRMSTPGVRLLVALTYAAAIDDPARFRSFKALGAYFGLTPEKYQSGETGPCGRVGGSRRRGIPELDFLRPMDDRHQGAAHADEVDGGGLGDRAGGIRGGAVEAWRARAR